MEVIISFFAQVILVLSLIGFGFQFTQILKILAIYSTGPQICLWQFIRVLDAYRFSAFVC